MNIDMNTRLQTIGDFCHEYLTGSYQKRSAKDKVYLDRFLFGPEYRWQHTLRVSQFGKLIAENEKVDREVIVTACLLHDVAWFDTRAEKSKDHGKIGAKVAQPLLEKLGFDPMQVKVICSAIIEHIGEGKPKTLEAKIVRDADDVDCFGPYRILQWCYSDIKDYEKLTLKLKDRIQRLEQYREDNPLFTTMGRQLYAEQLNLQIRFFREFLGERALSVLPQL
jgi:putative nucleotidyltransferase with HDIG domain